MNDTLIYIFLFLFFASCNSTQKKAQPSPISSNAEIEYPIHINLPEHKEKDFLNVSEFADSILYIPLETNPNSLLKRIAQVQLNDSIIAISDMQKILLFRYDGSFFRQIGREGKGPGEYGAIAHFKLKNDTLYIASRNIINKYLLDGTHLGDKSFNHSISYFDLTPQGKVAFYNAIKGQILYYDPNFIPTDTLVVETNVNPSRFNFQIADPTQYYFQESMNKLLFTNYMTDTIWNVTGAKKEAEYIFNLDEKLLPWDMQVEYFNGDFDRFYKEIANYHRINAKKVLDFVLILQHNWNKDGIDLNTIYLHNTKEDLTKAYDGKFIFDDIIGKIKLPGYLTLSTDKAFISEIQPTDLMERLDELSVNDTSNKIIHQQWIKKMSNVKFDDNPVLIVFKTKK